jgi:hypothetical protein
MRVTDMRYAFIYFELHVCCTVLYLYYVSTGIVRFFDRVLCVDIIPYSS